MITTIDKNSKIFIISLPRTGTTSVCALFLSLGFKTAHTAFTRYSFDQAQVIADTPVYCDYRQLDQLFPGSKFIYLDRSLNEWLPSISQLLVRMVPRLVRPDGFHPVMQRCFSEVFSQLTIDSAKDFQHLSACYERHQQQVNQYFFTQKQRLLCVDIAKEDALPRMLEFLNITKPVVSMPHLNQSGKIAQWKKINHPLKVSSNISGKGGRLFLEY